MAGRVAEIRRETGVLPLHFPRRGAAVCIWNGGEGEIPRADASAGEIHGVSSGFLLPDGQPLSYSAGGAADAGGRDLG